MNHYQNCGIKMYDNSSTTLRNNNNNNKKKYQYNNNRDRNVNIINNDSQQIDLLNSNQISQVVNTLRNRIKKKLVASDQQTGGFFFKTSSKLNEQHFKRINLVFKNLPLYLLLIFSLIYLFHFYYIYI
jgi:hypothetical protein